MIENLLYLGSILQNNKKKIHFLLDKKLKVWYTVFSLKKGFKKKYKYMENHTEKLNSIRHDYNNGKLIKEADWNELAKLTAFSDRLEARADSLKIISLTESFISTDIETFIVLSDTYKLAYKCLLNLEDYLTFTTGSDSIFSSDNEALKTIKTVLSDIEQIKIDNENYLTKEL